MKVLEVNHWVWRLQNIENQNITHLSTAEARPHPAAPRQVWGWSFLSWPTLGLFPPPPCTSTPPRWAFWRIDSSGIWLIWGWIVWRSFTFLHTDPHSDCILHPCRSQPRLQFKVSKCVSDSFVRDVSKLEDLKFFNYSDSKMNLLSFRRSKVTSCLNTITTS